MHHQNLLVVTLEEREKAKAWYTTEVKGIQAAKKPKKSNVWQASQAEINLDNEAKAIKAKYLATKLHEELQEKNQITVNFSFNLAFNFIFIYLA